MQVPEARESCRQSSHRCQQQEVGLEALEMVKCEGGRQDGQLLQKTNSCLEDKATGASLAGDQQD